MSLSVVDINMILMTGLSKARGRNGLDEAQHAKRLDVMV